MIYIALIILVQALYSASDLTRKIILQGREFGWSLLDSVPLWLTMILSLVGFVIQLFVLKHYDLSRTIIVMGCSAVVFSAILGAVVLKERMNALDIVGVSFAVLAVVFLHLKD